MHVKEHLANFHIHIDSKASTYLNMWNIEQEEIINRYLPLKNPNISYLQKKFVPGISYFVLHFTRRCSICVKKVH